GATHAGAITDAGRKARAGVGGEQSVHWHFKRTGRVRIGLRRSLVRAGVFGRLRRRGHHSSRARGGAGLAGNSAVRTIGWMIWVENGVFQFWGWVSHVEQTARRERLLTRPRPMRTTTFAWPTTKYDYHRARTSTSGTSQ